MARLARFLLPLTVSLGLLAGCQAPFTTPKPEMAIDLTPAVLAEPTIQDWTQQRVSGRHLAERREQYLKRELLAFPSPPSGWSAAGVNLTALGCAAGDYVPNGPASVYGTKSTPAAIAGKIFHLTRNGRFIRVDRSDPTDYTTLALGKTFSRTYVTLAPGGSRAYLVADDGTFFIVNTVGMTILDTLSLGAGAYGCAAFLDPYRSQHNGSKDEVYIPDNAGYVNKYTVTPGGASGVTKFPVATTVTPLYGETRKIKAPAVVLGGVIYVGDQGGALRVYDTGNVANNVAFAVGAPVNTSPAIEIQDGTYPLYDTLGNPKSVPGGTPIYAFVAAGASCAWINLHDYVITRSLSLHVDDNDAAKKFGYLLDYNYNTAASSSETMLAADWVNLRPEGGNLGTTGAVRDQGDLKPAQTNGSPTGTGSVVSYMRWVSTAPTAGGIISRATLTLAINGGSNKWTKEPEIRATSPYERTSGNLWNGATMTGGGTGNSPIIGSADVGSNRVGGTDDTSSPFYTQFPPNANVSWDVTDAFTAGPQPGYSLALAYASGSTVLWQPGVNSEAGGNPKKRDPVDGPNFHNGGNATKGPRLTIESAAGVMPTPSIETPPMIDAWKKCVYVFYTNALYQISFASTAAWADSNPASPQTQFQLTHYGDTANGGAMFYDSNSDGVKERYVGNYSAPMFNYNLSACFLLNRRPVTTTVSTPTNWNYAVSKVSLPLNNTNRLASTSTPVSNVANDASCYMIIDPYENVGSTGGNVHFGLGNGKIYQMTP